ncbi:hypothetical protein [Roseitranquillus sediminis]|uniref:hypothetical protein n=1 Tax=Roseitranquillus sediminis TaxID=2809051 RepID=UPI001D0CC545|nr:hypothetical protein [Roseitranquillus sediminis]MBM9594744.1 hypothetical protein [Roseitranquillus sediminis]
MKDDDGKTLTPAMSRFLEAENNMFDEIIPYVVGHDVSGDPVAPLRVFVGENRDALIQAAALLAGRRGARLAFSVADDLA